MKRLKAIWNILTCDDFFLAAYYEGHDNPDVQTSDKIKYIHPKLSQYFAGYIKEQISKMYDRLPKFNEK